MKRKRNILQIAVLAASIGVFGIGCGGSFLEGPTNIKPEITNVDKKPDEYNAMLTYEVEAHDEGGDIGWLYIRRSDMTEFHYLDAESCENKDEHYGCFSFRIPLVKNSDNKAEIYVKDDEYYDSDKLELTHYYDNATEEEAISTIMRACSETDLSSTILENSPVSSLGLGCDIYFRGKNEREDWAECFFYETGETYQNNLGYINNYECEHPFFMTIVPEGTQYEIQNFVKNTLSEHKDIVDLIHQEQEQENQQEEQDEEEPEEEIPTEPIDPCEENIHPTASYEQEVDEYNATRTISITAQDEDGSIDKICYLERHTYASYECSETDSLELTIPLLSDYSGINDFRFYAVDDCDAQSEIYVISYDYDNATFDEAVETIKRVCEESDYFNQILEDQQVNLSDGGVIRADVFCVGKIPDYGAFDEALFYQNSTNEVQNRDAILSYSNNLPPFVHVLNKGTQNEIKLELESIIETDKNILGY